MPRRTKPGAALIGALAVLAALTAACSKPPAPTPTPVPLRSTPTPIPTAAPDPIFPPDPWESAIEVEGFDGELVQWVPRDSIPAVFEPIMRPAEWGDELVPTDRAPEPRMSESEQVIGVSIDGDHRAYSVSYLGQREIVNDVVGGRKIAVTWCPLCYSAIVFDREVDGRELTFGVSGMLLMNSLVMYDRETESLWSQFAGEAVHGPMDGARLEIVASQLTPWSDWIRQHPDTLVLEKEGFPTSRDSYFGYYLSGSAGEIGETNEDGRLRTKEFVLGIVGERIQRAYSIRDLRKVWPVNDTFEDGDTVVLITNGGATTAVYSRSVGGRALTFERADSPFQMTDRETGSVWDMGAGVAVSGDLEGATLERLPSFVSFWFAWTDYHPGTELYEAPAGS